MPIVGMMLPGGDWQKLAVGPFQIGIVIAALIKFIIVAYFVFFVAKRLLREDTVAKK